MAMARTAGARQQAIRSLIGSTVLLLRLRMSDSILTPMWVVEDSIGMIASVSATPLDSVAHLFLPASLDLFELLVLLVVKDLGDLFVRVLCD